MLRGFDLEIEQTFRSMIVNSIPVGILFFLIEIVCFSFGAFQGCIVLTHTHTHTHKHTHTHIT